jgi:putative DNA primase/helicase
MFDAHCVLIHKLRILLEYFMTLAFCGVGTTGNSSFLFVAQRALEYVEPILETLLPGGELRGVEYAAFNPHRRDNELGSFKINTQTGVWCDFAESTDEAKGGDLISLAAYVLDKRQFEAMQWIQKLISTFEDVDDAELAKPTVQISKSPSVVKPVSEETTLVSPVPEGALPVPKAFGVRGAPSFIWNYTDALGAIVCKILRFDLPGGKKDICPLTYHIDDKGRASWKMQGIRGPRPLYNLHLLATQQEAPVILVEGEKSADAAAKLFPGHIAVTTIGGSNGAGKTDFSPLAGRDVTIWADADEPGYQYAEDVARRLQALSVPAIVRILQPICSRAGYDEQTKQPTLHDGFTAAKGWDAADALSEGWTAEHIKLLELPEPLSLEMNTAIPSLKDSQTFKTPMGEFRIDAQGVYFLRTTSRSEFWEWICAPLKILAETRSTANKNWGRQVEFCDADGVVHQLVLSLASLQQGNFFSQLADKGLRISPSLSHREKLIGYLINVKVAERATSMDRVGWSDGIFLLPGVSFGTSDERVVLQDDGRIDRTVFRISGEHGDWQEHVGKLCVGNSRLVLAVSTALSGPFLELTGIENGGFHFRGNSSIGKTITLQTAASVWGSPKFIRPWRATSNGLEATALTHNGTVLLLDELAQISSMEAGEVAYMLGNGQGKSRSNRTGGFVANTTWHFLFLSTGEISLKTHMGTAGKKAMAGQETRLLDIPADAGQGYGVFDVLNGVDSSRQIADFLKINTTRYYGTAGIELLKHLADPGEREQQVERVKCYQREFIEQYQGKMMEGQVLRALGRFGFVAAVGRVCTELGILPWSEGGAFQGCAACFHAWLEARGGDGNIERQQIIDQAIGVLQRYGESRFTELGVQGVNDDRLLSKSNDRIGFKKMGEVEYTYFAETEPFNALFCKGFQRSDVIRILTEEGILLPGQSGPTMNMRCGGFGQNRVYALRVPVLAETLTLH